MVITDMAGLSPNLKNTAKVKLQNMGFSDYLLMKFRKNIRNDDSDQGIQDFIKELAEIFTIDDPINSLISSQYIFVVGASGSGKTSFSAKLAATLVQDIKNYSVVFNIFFFIEIIIKTGFIFFFFIINIEKFSSHTKMD